MMNLVQERDVLVRSDERKTAGQLAAYRAKNNGVSIDGLPALSPTATRPASEQR